MPAFQQFTKTDKNSSIVIRYYPQQYTLVLMPNKSDKNEIRKTLSKLNTLLSVESTTFNPKDHSVEVKINNNIPKGSVIELLKSNGFVGGANIGDPQEQEEEQDETQQAQPPTPPPQQPEMPQPQMPSVPPGSPEEQQQTPRQESITYSSLYNMLYESTYRTGQYWIALERPVGKNKNQITDADVLKARKRYTSKPKTDNRDKVLRALDKAYKYFYRKIVRDVGPNAAHKFKEKYRSIGHLVPSDYAGKREDSDQLQPSEKMPQGQVNTTDMITYSPPDPKAYEYPEREDY